jgi:hypothetical protein
MPDEESSQNSMQRTQVKGAPNPSRSDVASANKTADQAAGHANKQRRESDAALRSPKSNPHYAKKDYGMDAHYGKKHEPGLHRDTSGRLSSGIERESRATAQNARSKNDSYSYPSPTRNRLVTTLINRVLKPRPLKGDGTKELKRNQKFVFLHDDNLDDSKKSLFIQSLRQTRRSQEEIALLESLYRGMRRMERKILKGLDIAENLVRQNDLPRMKKSLRHANHIFWNYVQLQKAIEEHCSESSCVVPKLSFAVMTRMQNLGNI